MKRELRAYLKRERISQRTFAARIGCNHTLVSMWANGKRKPARFWLSALHEATGIPLERML